MSIQFFGPHTQGNTPWGNSLFKAIRYSEDYSAFDGRDLTPGEVLELEPLPSDCEIHTITSIEEETLESSSLLATTKWIEINGAIDLNWHLKLIDLQGRTVFEIDQIDSGQRIEFPKLNAGLYVASATNENGTAISRVIPVITE